MVRDTVVNTFFVCLNLYIFHSNFHMADPLAALCIAMMTVGTMFPMSVYSGTILLQNHTCTHTGTTGQKFARGM